MTRSSVRFRQAAPRFRTSIARIAHSPARPGYAPKMSNEALKVSVIYYSATGNVDAMARHLAEAAESNGAVVRLRQVPELAPDEAIEANEDWLAHREATAEEPDAT